LGIVSVRSAWLWMGLAWVVAGVWASMDTQRIVVYGMGMCLGVLYNHKRWSWKDRPYVGLLANIVGHGSLTFVAGWMAAGGGSLAGAWASVPYGLAVGCTFILTTVVDHEGDRASGKNTLAVASGIRSAKRWASGCCSCAAIGGAVLGDVWMALAACVTLALMGWDVYYTKVGAGAIAKVSVGVLALTVALRWPPLLVMAGVTFVAARVYYSRRFQKRYPVLLDAGQKA
ncbi:MAG: UbiA family prenyltransferase, partial [Candidatus Latescibacteria bacterium]|nr:UbiA family prenyltransferase [Candidatus Latescibacterota bacterium]